MMIILDDIRSIYNVASIFRTADASGIEKIYLSGITPEPKDRFGKWRPRFVKVSLGAEKTVAWEKIKNANHLIARLKKDGCKILAVEQSGKSVPYFRFKARGKMLKKIVLVFGNEVKGIRPVILKKADEILEIPMRGKKESLNVAVAFGIAVYGLLYQVEKIKE